MSWYEKTVAALRERAATGRLVHGSEARDLLAEFGAGACCDGHTAEKALHEALEPVIGQGPDPTRSQLAWASLGNSAGRVWRRFEPSTKEAYYWRAKPGHTWRDVAPVVPAPRVFVIDIF